MLELLASIIISYMIVDDFKYRYVKTIHLSLLAPIIITITLSNYITTVAIISTLINLLFLTLLYLFVILYFREKPTKRLIGSGDIIFILIISPLWELLPFIIYLLTCFTTALIYHRLSNIKTIPLIGIMGIILIILWIAIHIMTGFGLNLKLILK